MKFYAGLDVGGTSGRVRFLDEYGQPIGEYFGRGCAFNTEGETLGRQKYTALMQEAMAQYQLCSCDCLGICVAASGIDSKAQEQSCRRIFTDMGFAAEKLLVVNDCELFLYLSTGPSMVVIAGTGSICFGRDTKGQVFRTGGWNHVISDEGSSYDIGLQTIRAAADCIDERIPATVLVDMLREQTGISSLEDADAFVNEHLMDKRTIGNLAAVCAKAADAGDEAAVNILKHCADRIYQLIADTYRKMDMSAGSDADLWLWGSVAVKNELFRQHLTKRLQNEMPFLTVSIPEKTALEIAADTARRHAAK